MVYSMETFAISYLFWMLAAFYTFQNYIYLLLNTVKTLDIRSVRNFVMQG